MRFENLSGRRFAYLTAVEPTHINGRLHWICRCDCGSEKVVRRSNLRCTTSCGCKYSENRHKASLKHGHNRFGKRSKEYRAWAHIIGRCHRETDAGYKDYGARGIAVCEPWRVSFDQFLADMGQAPSARHSIDRIDNDGDYCPENCRWATNADQSRNTRRNVIIDGLVLKDYCAKHGLKYGTVGQRLLRGHPIAVAISPLKGGAYRSLLEGHGHV